MIALALSLTLASSPAVPAETEPPLSLSTAAAQPGWLLEHSLVAASGGAQRALLTSGMGAEPNEPLPRGTVWWTIAGVAGGALFGAGALLVPGELIGNAVANSPNPAVDDRRRTAGAATGAAIGAIAGGVGGWFLGEAARDHSLAARIAIIAVGAVAATVAVVVVIAVAAAGSLFIPN